MFLILFRHIYSGLLVAVFAEMTDLDGIFITVIIYAVLLSEAEAKAWLFL